MSSGFISENEIAEAKQKRQEEWEKVRQPSEPLERPEIPYDSRSLYERLKEQRDKKDFEFEEAHKLKNLIRGLDDDEVDFLDVIDKAKMDADKQQHLEEMRELQDFRQKVASFQEKSMDNKLLAEASKPKPKTTTLSSRPSQKSILSGMVRKRKVSDTDATPTITQPLNGNSTNGKCSQNATEVVPSEQPTIEKQPKLTETAPAATGSAAESTGLRCIGILPGIGKYTESSDSDKSTDTDEDYDYGKFDWVGRKIDLKECIVKSKTD